MSKKSIFLIIFTLILSLSFQSVTFSEKDSDTKKETEAKETVKEESEDSFPEIHTDYYLLADLDTGKVLESKNGDEQVFPASTTKILTAIIVLENCNLADVVTATEEAISPINSKHSNMGILIGEELTVEQLLYGLLVDSANDAANVLAVHTSGSLDKFAELMNERAKELGAENTHFINAHGFHDDNHYTTVNDMAKMACYAMQNEKFREIVATAKYEIPPTNKYKDSKNNNIRYLSNTNRMISSNNGSMHLYEYAIGVKTGSTDEAGNCLVAAAEKNGTRLLSIVMKCKNENTTDKAYSFTDSRALLEYGFKNYEHQTIASVMDVVGNSEVRNAKNKLTVALSPSQDINVILSTDVQKSDIKVVTKIDENISAPIEKGEVLGKATYLLGDEELGSVSLIAGNAVEYDVIVHIISTVREHFFLIVLLVVLLLISFIYIKGAIKRRTRAKRRSMRLAGSEYTPQRRRRK